MTFTTIQTSLEVISLMFPPKKDLYPLENLPIDKYYSHNALASQGILDVCIRITIILILITQKHSNNLGSIKHVDKSLGSCLNNVLASQGILDVCIKITMSLILIFLRSLIMLI